MCTVSVVALIARKHFFKLYGSKKENGKEDCKEGGKESSKESKESC